MADRISKEARSLNMSKIRSKNTRPEILVRSALHRMGYRFRVHKKDLPGKPDIVLKKQRVVVFVNGCFWHRHLNCKDASRPRTNSDYWEQKITGNVQRDKKNMKILIEQNWNVVLIWECEIENDFLSNKRLIENKFMQMVKMENG